MELAAKFAPVTEADLEKLRTQVEGNLSEQDFADFRDCVKPYETLTHDQLDEVFLLVELTLTGTGQIETIVPDCGVNQKEWWVFEDEEDMRIDDVVIPLQLVTPKDPIDVSGSKTFFVVLKAIEEDLWSSCKKLPKWVWDQRALEFMVNLTVTSSGNKFRASASQPISW